jgi:hypothetical protein
MGTKLFGVDIAGIIKTAMAPGLPQATLMKPTVGALDSAAPTATPSVSYRPFPCRGFEDTTIDNRVPGTATQQPVRRILLIGDTLPSGVLPEPGDLIVILGETLEITGKGVTSDPARATYVCDCLG